MTMLRFGFQQNCIGKLPSGSTAADIGAELDPGGLKAYGLQRGVRVLDCDLVQHPNTDVVMDVTESWPFAEDELELVILGDILEHLTWPEITFALFEARRVADRLCITVPSDTRIGTDGHWKPEMGLEIENFGDMGYRPHVTVVTESGLLPLLRSVGWNVAQWLTVNYTFCPEGYLIECERRLA